MRHKLQPTKDNNNDVEDLEEFLPGLENMPVDMLDSVNTFQWDISEILEAPNPAVVSDSAISVNPRCVTSSQELAHMLVATTSALHSLERQAATVAVSYGTHQQTIGTISNAGTKRLASVAPSRSDTVSSVNTVTDIVSQFALVNTLLSGLISSSDGKILTIPGSPKSKKMKLDKSLITEDISKKKKIMEHFTKKLSLLKNKYYKEKAEYFFLKSGGNIMDHLVWMKKLPTELLEYLKANKFDSHDDVTVITECLSRSYAISNAASGIKDISSINAEKTLCELGMDSLMVLEVKQFLEHDFELVLSIPELRKLKIKGEGDYSISSSEKVTDSENASAVENIPGHFNSLFSKELVPSETIVHMNSVKTGTPLFIVHPIEGTVVMLQSLAQILPYPVYGIQYTPEAPSDSVEDLAAWYWKHVKTFGIATTSIYLAGYSFGASVAFEMTLQADRSPRQHLKINSLIMLDGSPALVTSYTREHKSHFQQDSQVEGETQALFSFAYLFTENNLVQKKDLLGLSSYAERMQYTAEKIRTVCPELRIEDLKTAFDLYYKKLLISLKYTPKYRLQRDVSLIKASESVEMAKNFSDVYDLEKICDGKITVYSVKGTHNSFIQGKGAKEISNLLSKIVSH